MTPPGTHKYNPRYLYLLYIFELIILVHTACNVLLLATQLISSDSHQAAYRSCFQSVAPAQIV